MTHVDSNAVESKILTIRGQKIMIDNDLARLYGVEAKYLNRQVRRNIKRFPPEFMFRLSKQEKTQLVTNWHQFKKLKHSHSLPYAFTEHGVAMLASVMNSDTAIRISIHIVKTFIRLRELAANYSQISDKLNRLEQKIGVHDSEIRAIIQALHDMTAPPKRPKRQIGFHAA